MIDEYMKKKVYISGKISGIPREQYMKMFGIAEQMLREKGYKAVNPTRFFLSRHYQRLCRLIGHQNAYDLTLLYDLWRLMHCDLIYKIPGWKQSRGANIESCVAFHFGLWTLPTVVRERVDRKLAKDMDKWRKRQGGEV